MWSWDNARYEAAGLIAAGRLSNAAIARQCGVSPRTIDVWKRAPEFEAEVERLKNAWRERVLVDGIADKQLRVSRLNDRWRRLQSVIDRRAKHWREWEQKEHKRAPEGATAGVLDIEGFVDVKLFKEIRAHEQQAARELGQWNEEKPTQKHVILVMPQTIAPAASTPMIAPPPEPPPRELPGVIIDLAPQR